jgi:hypothetical protein
MQQHHKHVEVHPGQQRVYGDPEHALGEPVVPAAQARDRVHGVKCGLDTTRVGIAEAG